MVSSADLVRNDLHHELVNNFIEPEPFVSEISAYVLFIEYWRLKDELAGKDMTRWNVFIQGLIPNALALLWITFPQK